MYISCVIADRGQQKTEFLCGSKNGISAWIWSTVSDTKRTDSPVDFVVCQTWIWII